MPDMFIFTQRTNQRNYHTWLLICLTLCIGFMRPTPATTYALGPTPEGCGGVTPPGGSVPLCCISGFVYGNGQPLSGAEIQIDTISATMAFSTTTEIHSGDETRPYYRLNLDVDPFRVQSGETITVTARYNGHERSQRYLVQPGGQQLDLVLLPQQSEDYLFERHIGDAPGLNSPQAVAFDSHGRFYVLDTNNHKVHVFERNGAFVAEWGSQGSQSGQFNQPAGIAIGAGDLVYIADTMNHRIQQFRADGMWLASWGSQGSNAGQLSYPEAVAVDLNGKVYVADTENNRIQKFNPDGSWLASWGSQGSAPGQFDGPTGVAADQAGHLYVADKFNHRIQKLSSAGTVFKSWGSYGTAAGQFIEPHGIAVDSAGNVYVADSGNDRIQKFSGDGIWRSSWGMSGIDVGSFVTIYGLAVAGAGRVAVADAGRQRIDSFLPMTETRPIATISHISSDILAADEVLTVIGMGADSDTSLPISSYRWTSDRQGLLSEKPALVYPAARLLPGNHLLSLTVQDAQRQWSEPVTIPIFVERPKYQVFLPSVR